MFIKYPENSEKVSITEKKTFYSILGGMWVICLLLFLLDLAEENIKIINFRLILRDDLIGTVTAVISFSLILRNFLQFIFLEKTTKTFLVDDF